jgi:hypothetical protein
VLQAGKLGARLAERSEKQANGIPPSWQPTTVEGCKSDQAASLALSGTLEEMLLKLTGRGLLD